MQLPPIPLPSLQRNILILILTWGTETSAGPLNWAFEHRSKKRSFTAINASYCITQSCAFKKLSRNLSCVSIWMFFNLVSRRFKGTLWMSEEHPLSLVEQVTPIIDLMARTSSHFARLRDFVTLKFPPGFPVKIGTWQVLYRHYTFKKHISEVSFYIQSAVLSSLAEIPLFHVLNARITFGNVNKCSTEEEANTTPAATPTSSGEDEEAAGGNAASFHHQTWLCIKIVARLWFLTCFSFGFSSVQRCLLFKCVLQCLRCLSVTNVEEAAGTHPCPTTTRSFCSTPSIRVSWSLAESRARSEEPSACHAQICHFPCAHLDFAFHCILQTLLMFVSL